ncbi:MAG TPA: tail fiber domain-containing protein [Bacteroidia bacterium]
MKNFYSFGKMMPALVGIFSLMGIVTSNAQDNVGIGTNTPNPSAILDILSTNKGILVPRVTTAQRLAIATGPTTQGLLVYDTNFECYFYWNSTSSQWISLCQLSGPTGPTGANGSTGTNGSSGINCWDINGNGTNDPSEDVNGDGVWNTLDCQGAQGSVGPTGPQGLQGPTGTNGLNGATGPTGDPGPTGSNGATGLQGPTGANGTNGVTGPTGAQGPTGVNGTNGVTGPTGANGTNGTNGVTGPTGAQGPTGANGTNGTNGVTGPTGAQGPTGANGTNGTNGVTGPTGAQGPTGANGTNGTNGVTGPTGAQGPTGANGTNGTNGVTGPTGANGTNGANGATGPTGAQGPTGANGTNGTNGANGATGPTGPQGPTGANGTNGANGATGPTGANGTNGTNGATGPTGNTGNTGAQGPTGPTGPIGCLSTNYIIKSNGSSATCTQAPIFESSVSPFTVGIGTTIPSTSNIGGINVDKLNVYSTTTLNNSGMIEFSNASTLGVSMASANLSAVNNFNANEGITYGTYSGLFGLHIPTTGTGYGVYAVTNSQTNSAFGIYAQCPFTNSAGFYAGYFSGRVFATGGYFVPSDGMLKKNIIPLTNGLDKILKLEPVEYDFNETYSEFVGSPEHQAGFIAQDVEKIFPGSSIVSPITLTSLGKNLKPNSPVNRKTLDAKGISYSSFVPYLVLAIKEQQKMIEDQKIQIQDLNTKILELQKLMEEMNAKISK